MAHKKFQYATTTHDQFAHGSQPEIDFLNKHGEKGWEHYLTEQGSSGVRSVYYFKREITE